MRRTCLLLLILTVMPALDPHAEAQDATAATSPAVVTDPVYPVSVFKVRFDREVASIGLDADQLLNQPIAFSVVDGVYTGPQQGAEVIQATLGELAGNEPKRFDVTGLRAVIDDLLRYLNDEVELIGIVVAPDPNDIGVDLSDRRLGRTDLTILIRVASVGRLRTLASGDRVPGEERENNPVHQSLRDRSPLQPGEEPRTGSLLQRNLLDEYLYRLNRYPGRRVDAAISPGLEAGEVTLDYLVGENKPWYVYFQLSNTGTESTNELRERFGFVHNQLTNHDDTFSVDYITAGFDDSHVVTLGYERPLTERLKYRLSALYSEFTADQVGSPLAFEGQDASFGGELVYNIFQRDALFIDAVGGLEYYFTSAQNPGAALDGEQSFLLGSIGLEFERSTDLSSTRGQLMLRGNFNDGDSDEMAALGRTAPDSSFLILQYAVGTSFFLEPLLNRAAWEDISDPSSSTLAHEVALSLRGQTGFGDRLVPTFEAVAGGLYTVRGYTQAAVAGDSSLIASAEYRFHVPRALPIESPRALKLFDRPFRARPESVYGRPDWDLVLKAFVDYAVIDVASELAFETDETLMSTGVGFEVSLKNNVSFRGEWGFALQDAGTVDAGDSEFHFVLTLLY